MNRNSFFSKDELLQQSNVVKRRLERLNQVRQQSKQMSSEILQRVKQEAKKQCEEIENQVLAEIRNYHLKELEYRRQQYEKCIAEINEQHYFKQINTTDVRLPISQRRKTMNLVQVENSAIAPDGFQNENESCKKSNTEHFKHPAQISSKENCFKKSCHKDAGVKVLSSKKLPQNIIFDSVDENVKEIPTSNSCKQYPVFPPKTKLLTSLDCAKTFLASDSETKTNCVKNEKSSGRDNISGSELDNNSAKDSELNKMEIDERYNHLVHDRIRILEQKNKILSRQTMLLPKSAEFANDKSSRFSEYFARHYHKTNGSVSKKSIRNDEKIHEIMGDMKRVQLKKKLLVQELTNSENRNDSKISASEKKVECTKTDDHCFSEEKTGTNGTSGKKSPTSSTAEASTATQPQDKVYPSPIKKTSITSTKNCHEFEKRSKQTKFRNCKRIHRLTRDVSVIVSNETGVYSNTSSTSSSANHDGMVGRNAVDNDLLKCTRKLPINIVVNVHSPADCKIQIQKNNSQKRYTQVKSEKNSKKIENWRTLFKNEEKLTESSYYSPPDNQRVIAFREDTNIGPNENARGIGYYVRKLLLMSPESIENLDVSSCNTTLIDESSVHSVDSLKTESDCTSSHETTIESKYELETTENHDTTVEGKYDAENVRALLLNCLRLATNEKGETKLPYFKSINSSCDYKSCDNFSPERHTESSNLVYSNFLNNAIQRLLPFYQNSLDDNLETSMLSAASDFHATKALMKQTANESEVNLTAEEESTYVSTSAYLQKFVSSLSSVSEKGNEKDTLECLKQYVKLPSPVPGNGTNSFNSEYLQISPKHDALPSLEELVQKGLINKAFALDELAKNDEGKEFIDEEEFIRRMLQVDFSTNTAEEKYVSDSLNNADQSRKVNENLQSIPGQQNFVRDDAVGTSVDNIRKEMRLIGLGWMDTTLQRTLQASAISSTSSTEDSAAQLRAMPATNEKLVAAKYSTSSSENPVQTKEHISISPITVPDIHLSIPNCFFKN